VLLLCLTSILQPVWLGTQSPHHEKITAHKFENDVRQDENLFIKTPVAELKHLYRGNDVHYSVIPEVENT